jgi:hypothetical protein
MKHNYSLRLLFSLGIAASLVPTLCSAAPFTPGNIVVARVGDGSATLTSAATEVFLDEYTRSGTLVQSIALPTSVSGNNRILTASGNVTTELGMTMSTDGHYLVLTGYSAAPGTSAVASSQAIDITRVIGLIGADGSIDTSTSTGDAFSGTSIRTAVSADGTSFYSVGGDGGVQYQTFGNYQSTQLTTDPADIRSVNIADGKLYISTNSSPYIGLSQVGVGLPTTAQTVTVLSGFPASTAGASPNAFYFADLSTDVPGVDVVYVADDRTVGGGIQKWSLVGSTWVRNGTITSTATTTVRGLNGSSAGSTASLVASSNNRLFFLEDTAGYNMAPSITALRTATAMAGINTAFRGVAFAPVAAAPTIASFTPISGPVGTTVTVTGTHFNGATSVTLNGVDVPNFTVLEATTLAFEVPTGATSGLIAVTTPGGTATSTSSFMVVAPNPAPTLTNLTPATASAGSGPLTIALDGTGFSSSSLVSFNGSVLATTLVSPTQLTAVVPASILTTAGTYTVTVTNPAPGGGTSTASTFTVVAPAPTIASFTPAMGGPGTTVTITGTNFMGATAVKIGSLAISDYTVASATTITLVLPSSTSNLSGFLTVVTPGGTATSTTSFNSVLATIGSQALPGLAVFPNPATDYVQLELPQPGSATVTLRDLMGRVVVAPIELATRQALYLPASLAAGVYLLEVRQGAETAVRRFQKN